MKPNGHAVGVETPLPMKPEDVLQFETGAKRSTVGEETRYDLISEFGLYRLAKTYQEGSKYGDNNWRKGMPFSCLINRVLRHINEWKQGDRGEDHLAHAAWGLFALMEFEATKPELHDLYGKPHIETGVGNTRPPHS